MITGIKKVWIITGALILILALFNPTLKDFKEFSGVNSGINKESNFLIFSIYKDYNGVQSWDYRKYLGIVKNFYDITSERELEEQHRLDTMNAKHYK